jgi:ceramide glucosyltransferase
MPFALLGAGAAAMLHHPMLAVSLAAWGLLNRSLMALLAGWKTVGDENAKRFFWLFPLRDLMGFCFWVLSFFGNTVVWRSQTYELHAGGKMVATDAAAEVEEAAKVESTPVAVDHLA